MKNRALIDLVGVACPLSWARTKNRLEGMEQGQLLELITDDPRALRDIPAAAEGEGYLVVSIISDDGRGAARIIIER